MFDYNKAITCNECGHDQYKLFVDPQKGQGIRCDDCGHEKIIVTPQTKNHKKRFRIRMKDEWDKAKNSTKGEF